jgi:hypothetical protein
MSALPLKADIETGTQQLGQLGDIRRDPPRFAATRRASWLHATSISTASMSHTPQARHSNI